MITVFLVDDHEVVRRGVAASLSDEPDITVVGEAASVAHAKARIPALRPDVVLLDLRLPDGNGVELCRDLLSALPGLKCLMLTAHTEERAMLDAVLAGASGYIVKDLKSGSLAPVIRQVAAGQSLLDNRAAAALMGKIRADAAGDDPQSELSARERELLAHIGDGLTNRQIADRMFLAEKTVKNYVSKLLAKLGMQRRTQAAAYVAKIRSTQRPRY